MPRRKPPKRRYKILSFKVYYDDDPEILEWWEGLPDGDRSEEIRDVLRDFVDGPEGREQRMRKTNLLSLDLELARVRDDTTWIREALNDIPAYLERVVQTVSTMQPVMTVAAGEFSLQHGPSLATQIVTEREANIRKGAQW